MGMDSFVVLFDRIYVQVLQVKHKIMKFAGQPEEMGCQHQREYYLPLYLIDKQ